MSLQRVFFLYLIICQVVIGLGAVISFWLGFKIWKLLIT